MSLKIIALTLLLAPASQARGPSPAWPLARRDCTFTVPASEGDTCASLADFWGLDLAQFQSYNPGVSCAGTLVAGQEYCIEWDGGQQPTTTSSTTSSATTTTSSLPSPTQPGLAADCDSFYKVVKGDTCSKIVDLFGTFTIDDFYKWNPAVESDCSALQINVYVCVGVPGTPTAKPTSITTTTTATNTGPQPEQTGIASDCNAYHKVSSGDTCSKIQATYGNFTIDSFYAWNPAVGSDCSSLLLGYYVCIGTSSAAPVPTTITTTTNTAPQPEQTGIISTCKSWYQVASGDTCQKIVDKYGTFTLANFISWNPAVGADCSSLFLGYYVCVGVPSTPTSRPTITTTTVAAGPTPTQTGIAAKCNSYYLVKSGDFCQAIVDSYKGKFTLAQFYSWNPAVGSDCANLWVGYYVCVGVST